MIEHIQVVPRVDPNDARIDPGCVPHNDPAWASVT